MNKRSPRTKTTRIKKAREAHPSSDQNRSNDGNQIIAIATRSLVNIGKRQDRIILTLNKAIALQAKVDDLELTPVQLRIAKQNQNLIEHMKGVWERSRELRHRVMEQVERAERPAGPLAAIRDTSVHYYLLELEAATNALDLGSRELLANTKSFLRLARP